MTKAATRTKGGTANVPQKMRLTFEQRGQDFSWFEAEYDGLARGANDVHVPVYKIMAVGPFQEWLWKDKLLDGTTVFLGGRPAIKIEDEWRPLNYPVIELQEEGSVAPGAAS